MIFLSMSGHLMSKRYQFVNFFKNQVLSTNERHLMSKRYHTDNLQINSKDFKFKLFVKDILDNGAMDIQAILIIPCLKVLNPSIIILFLLKSVVVIAVIVVVIAVVVVVVVGVAVVVVVVVGVSHPPRHLKSKNVNNICNEKNKIVKSSF